MINPENFDIKLIDFGVAKTYVFSFEECMNETPEKYSNSNSTDHSNVSSYTDINFE